MSMHPLFDLTGRVALVSGAAQNLGKNCALALAEAGADLMVADVNVEGNERTAAEIRAMGRKAIPVTCNVSSIEQIRAMFQQLDREFGKIDILFNIPGGHGNWAPEDLRLEDLEEIIHAIIIARFCLCQEGGRRMLAQGKGSIVNMCSIGGFNALGRGNCAFSIGMGGVIQMTRELSTEWSGRGVRVNAILPAQITSAPMEARMDATPGLREMFLHGIPMGRLGVPSDIKGLAIFLASDASSFMTGSLFPLDGGNLAKNAGGSHPAPIKK